MKNKYFIFGIIFLLVAGIVTYKNFRKSTGSDIKKTSVNTSREQGNNQAQKQEEAGQQAEAVNGLKVDQSIAEKRPIAVMVENHPDARPQSGLADADLVYETLAEGGITRFMAVYQTKEASNIGPIRSARTYYAELADELHAVYAHVGGNSDALENIKNNVYKKISDADQFFDDGTFFHRIKERVAPHNVYSSVSKLRSLISFHKFPDKAGYQPWKYKDDSAGAVEAAKININFSYPDYAVAYQYIQKDNNYARLMAGKPHVDLDSKKQIAAKNIVVQFVETYPVKSDTPLAIGLKLDEGGQAYAFLDGKAISGTWKKQDGRTRYYDANGKEIEFNRGVTWVELVPKELKGEVKWSK